MIAGFRKPKRNFRKKVADDDDDDQAVEEKEQIPFLGNSVETIAQSVPKPAKKSSSKSKEKSKSSKPAGLLSFEDEIEEGEQFQLKKTKESRKLMQKIKEEKKRKKVSKIEIPDKAPVHQVATNSVPVDVESKPNEIQMGSDLESESDDDDSAMYSNVHSDLSTGVIPDAATIFALKKQRERARTAGPGADFVPLQTTVKYQNKSNSSKSRLVREDDDDSDEDRIEFKGSQKKSFPALERRKEVSIASN